MLGANISSGLTLVFVSLNVYRDDHIMIASALAKAASLRSISGPQNLFSFQSYLAWGTETQHLLGDGLGNKSR